ncbi:MAG: hypothetical protein DCF16_01690 [Alphaproteobacteria bacterium]|nr:MAG: hypothetical protein DCF16_01690 [Alphaproteobacteria bacterium]
MIKTDRQLAYAKRDLEAFEAEHKKLLSEPAPKDVAPRMYQNAIASAARMAKRIRDEIDEYELLKAGDTEVIAVETLSSIPRALIQTRIVRKLTQKQLAEKLGVKEQQVQRWEQQEYENASYATLLDVAEALEFDLSRHNRKCGPTRAAQVARAKRIVAPRDYGVPTALPEWPNWEKSGFDPGRLLQVLQKASTFNHTATTQYSFIGSDKHKSLRIARDQGADDEELLRVFQNLYGYLKHDFEFAVARNAGFLRSSFAGRPGAPPRICLKSNMVGRHGEKEITPLFRDSRVGYDSSVPLDGNTGFSQIAKTGNFYLQNDIPSAVARGEYVNPRIDQSKIHTDFGGRNADFTKLYDRWHDYWTKREGQEEDAAAFYKSTLIMPLKLWDSEISPEFRVFLEGLEIDTRIFGYLCLDHTEVDYFNAAVDLNMAKIVADALCTMLLLRMKWTTHSSNTHAVSKIPIVAKWLSHQDTTAPAIIPQLVALQSELPSLETEGEPLLVSAELGQQLAAVR